MLLRRPKGETVHCAARTLDCRSQTALEYNKLEKGGANSEEG